MRFLGEPTGAASSGWLDRSMPRWLCGLILFAIALAPLWYVAGHYHREYGFTELILFAKNDAQKELPEIRALHPATLSDWGYDGGMYAQLALDPTFRRQDLHAAVPQVAYRSQRFLPILLAYVFGLGHPSWILTAYVLQHPAFWLILVALLAGYMRGRTPRQYLCLAAAALSTGALICIERSLGDLPGATLALGSTLIDGVAAACLISLATLCKPSFVTAIARYAWPLPATKRQWLERAGLVILALAAVVILHIYLTSLFGHLPSAGKNTNWPFVEWGRRMPILWHNFIGTPFKLSTDGVSFWEWNLWEVVVPICLLVQAVALVIWRDFRSPLWWLGITFAALFICLGEPVTAEEIASARTVLPMTLVFNMLLAEKRGAQFWSFFVAGNLGLFWCFHDMASWCVSRIF